MTFSCLSAATSPSMAPRIAAPSPATGVLAVVGPLTSFGLWYYDRYKQRPPSWLSLTLTLALTLLIALINYAEILAEIARP